MCGMPQVEEPILTKESRDDFTESMEEHSVPKEQKLQIPKTESAYQV